MTVAETQFDSAVHISTRYNTSAKNVEPQVLQADLTGWAVEILHERAFQLLTASCCRLIRDELSQYHLGTGHATGPTLAQSAQLLPFTYQVLTCPKIREILSSMAGFEFDFCDSFEISQFASRDIAGSTDVDIDLTHWRAVPYTFVCVVQLDDGGLDELPPGMATILEGKLVGNLSSMQLAQTPQDRDYKLNLLLVMKPANVVEFENMRFSERFGSRSNRLLRHTQTASHDSSEDIGDIVAHLDSHYEKILHDKRFNFSSY